MPELYQEGLLLGGELFGAPTSDASRALPSSHVDTSKNAFVCHFLASRRFLEELRLFPQGHAFQCL